MNIPFRHIASFSVLIGSLLSTTLSFADNDDSYQLSNDTSYIRGKIETVKHIYYPGDTLDVRISFGGDTALLSSQGVEAYVVAYDQNQTSSVVKIDDYSSFTSSRMFYLDSVSTQTLAEGSYQLALILVRAGGNPSHTDDWYNGFAGLLDTDAVYSSSTAISGDNDLDGEWDGDDDRDGFYGDDTSDNDQDRDWNDDDWDDDSDDEDNDDD